MSRRSSSFLPNAFSVLFFLSAATACESPLAPRAVAGTYILREVGGDPLPTVLSSNSDVIVHVLVDTLRLTALGVGTQIGLRVLEPARPSISAPDTFRVSERFHFRMFDDRIEVTFDCPPGADCTSGPHLVLHPTTVGLLGVGGTLVLRGPLDYGLVSNTP
jgi:hypothetical protein